MRSHIKSFLFAILILFSVQAEAGNPISWRLNQNLQNPVFVGRTYSLTYTFTNQLPFPLAKAIQITKSASPSNEFTYTDNCSGLRLTQLQSCTVTVTLVPVVSGRKSVQLSIAGYSNDVVPLPVQITQTPGGGPSGLGVEAFVTQALPGTLQVGQSANYLFTFTNKSSSVATNFSVQSAQSTDPSYVSNCGSTLAANGGLCTVSGIYTPTSATPASQTVSATANYNNGSSVTASTSTTVTSATGVVAHFNQPFYLPPVMVGGASNTKTVWVLFTNYNSGPISITASSLDITAGSGGTFTVDSNPAFNNCSGTLGGNGASCQIRGVFEAPTEVTPTAFTVTGSLTYTGQGGGTAAIATSTEVVASLGTSRTVTFVNNCNFDVWFSLNGSAVTTAPNCSSDPSVCPPETACNQGTGQCFWKNQEPLDKNYHLTASGGTNTVSIPATSVDPVVQWSGNFSASTLCDGSSHCGQADCLNSGGSKPCSPGQGFSQPATQAEITMNLNGADSYDVEVINGFHIPISMTPGPYVVPNNYNCGVPGSDTSGNGFGACLWSNAVVPGNGYYWVTSGGAACNINTPSCPNPPSPAGSLCGLDSSFNQVCGSFLGFWTPDQVCGSANVPSSVQTYFSCNQPLPTSSGFPVNSTLKELMLCAVPKGDVAPPFNSCYQPYSGFSAQDIAQCCGCVDWWNSSQTGGTVINANDTAQSCTQSGAQSPQTDPQWTQFILSGIKWIKKTCPSAYTYPFDDATSGFSCTNNLPGASNSVGYTITFCPGNDTGLPSGANEGR